MRLEGKRMRCAIGWVSSVIRLANSTCPRVTCYNRRTCQHAADVRCPQISTPFLFSCCTFALTKHHLMGRGVFEDKPINKQATIVEKRPFKVGLPWFSQPEACPALLRALVCEHDALCAESAGEPIQCQQLGTLQLGPLNYHVLPELQLDGD